MPAALEDNLFSISKTAKKLGVSVSTLRRWDQIGKFKAIRTAGNQRRYNQKDIIDYQSGLYNQPPNFAFAFKPQHFLYTAIAAIATVQVLGLIAINSHHVNKTLTQISRNLPRSQTAFNHSLFTGSLYAATNYFNQFYQGFDSTSSYLGALIVTTSRRAGQQLAADMTTTINHITTTGIALAAANQPLNNVLGAQTNKPDKFGTITIKKDQNIATINLKSLGQNNWPTAPQAVLVTAQFDSYVWVTDITEDGFNLHIKNPPQKESLIHWLAIWK